MAARSSSSSSFVPTFGQKYLAIVGQVIVNEGDDLQALRAEVLSEKGYVVRTDRYQSQQAVAAEFGALSSQPMPTDDKVILGKPQAAAAQAVKAFLATPMANRKPILLQAAERIAAVEKQRPGTVTDKDGKVWYKAIAAGLVVRFPSLINRMPDMDDSGLTPDRQILLVAQAAALEVSPHILKVNAKDLQAWAALV